MKFRRTDFLDSAELEVAHTTDTVDEEKQVVDPLGLAIVDVELVQATFDDPRSAVCTLQIRSVFWTLLEIRISKEPCVYIVYLWGAGKIKKTIKNEADCSCCNLENDETDWALIHLCWVVYKQQLVTFNNTEYLL